jgi:osmotically-inducible protein OsmY
MVTVLYALTFIPQTSSCSFSDHRLFWLLLFQAATVFNVRSIMQPAQLPVTNPDEFSRCEERKQKADHKQSLNPIQKTDAVLKRLIERALGRDDILRAIEYEINVQVKNGIVYLYGHIVNISSKRRIENAIRSIPDIRGMQNHLVLDDKLTLEVAGSLGELERIYGCKFFTGASHGVISLNGNVKDENVKLLAEQRAASHPNVRGVVNNVRVAGVEQDLQERPFLQPAIGAIIYFLDGVSGVVKQVIINPDNRRVKAMIIRGRFTDQHDTHTSRGPVHLVAVPMNEVRYLTGVSGFLYIKSNERNRYTEFNPDGFFTPENSWSPPHPYCPEDVLFSVKRQKEVEYQVLEQPRSKELLTGASL